MEHVLIKRSAFSSLSREKFVRLHLVNTAPSVPSQSIKIEIDAFLTRDVTDERNLSAKRKNRNNNNNKKRANNSYGNFSNKFAILFSCDVGTLDVSCTFWFHL